MAGGMMDCEKEVLLCSCGVKPQLIWHYMQGVANRVHYFVKCYGCLKRTQDRRNPYGAITEWRKK